MGWLFKNREDAITCNSDAAADAWRQAAKAKKTGDAKAVKAWTDWARDCDQTATGFANGDYDDVLKNP